MIFSMAVRFISLFCDAESWLKVNSVVALSRIGTSNPTFQTVFEVNENQYEILE